MNSKNIWNKKIPTLLGLFLIILGVGVTTYLVQIGAIPFINAAPSETPTNIRITNITDNSFSVTYATADTVIGTISYGKDKNLGNVALDDRDQKTGNPQNYNLHSITARNLNPNTTYYFSILSGKTTFLNNNANFTVKTASKISSTPTQTPPISGKILLPDSTTPLESLVYLKTTDSQLISTLTNTDGIYILPINTLRKSDLTNSENISDNTKFDLFAVNSDLSSTILWTGNSSSPVPQITLGNNYDFTTSQTPIASNSALPVGFPSFNLDTSLNATPLIESPTDNEQFSDNQPLFAGKALPNSNVQITIHSNQAIDTTIKSDPSGNWIYRPNTPLAPGSHTITITTTNAAGVLQTIERSFTIFASGTTVAEAATPSAIPTLLPSATSAPTPTNVPILKSTLVPTSTPTLIPTQTTSNFTTTPTPTIPVTLPSTGSNSSVTVGLIGLLGSISGIALFLISKGATQ